MIENAMPPLAFPSQPLGMDGLPDHSAVSGMTLRDWFATFAPDCGEDYVRSQMDIDRGRNPHNETGIGMPPLRSQQQIRAGGRYEWADAMLAARAQ